MDDSSARTLWCGNLAWAIAEELLFDLFLQAGPLEKVFIPRDRDGRSRGYGFITFKHECSVPYAMELLQGTTLCGKMINLQHQSRGKNDSMPNDSRNPHHQRSMSYQEQGNLSGSSAPHDSQTQSINNLYNTAADFLAHCTDWNRQPVNQNHQRSRSNNMGGRYHDGGYRDERRGHYGNRNDRHQARDNGYRGRPRDNNYHDGFRGSNFRDRDQNQSRSNKRPTHKRFR